MPFTVADFQDLLKLLREHPEWRMQLWAVLAGEELLRLPGEFRAFREETDRRFGELTEAVRQLAEAQRRHYEEFATYRAETDRRFAELAEAQARTEERVGRLEAAVTALAEAQARTEERVGRLEAAVTALAEAQARTEERVEQLARAVGKLDEAVGALRREVGVLANTVGVTAEEEAALAIEYLLRGKGFEIFGTPGPVAADGFEVDLAFPVRDPAGRTFTVVTEVKFRLSPGHIRDWARRVRSEGFKEALSRAGLPGPYLVYVYGLRAMAGTEETARAEGVGLVTPRGERVPPAEVA
jgi:multidrug efflux pump subunit AcrA (membrane-fusion protein)